MPDKLFRGRAEKTVCHFAQSAENPVGVGVERFQPGLVRNPGLAPFRSLFAQQRSWEKAQTMLIGGSCLFSQGVIFGEDVVRFRATVRNYVRESARCNQRNTSQF